MKCVVVRSAYMLDEPAVELVADWLGPRISECGRVDGEGLLLELFGSTLR